MANIEDIQANEDKKEEESADNINDIGEADEENEEHKNLGDEAEDIIKEEGDEDMEESDSDAIKIDKLTLWKAVAGIIFILLLISIYTSGFSFGTAKPSQAPLPSQAPVPRPSAPGPALDMIALADDDAVKGSLDAPVTIVEWSDFECPFCTRFYEQTLGQLEEEYINTGKVKFVYRDFPLGFHANAQKAAEAAECAGEQGKYWEMHDALFEKGVSGGISSFKQFAEDIGIDTASFNECLDSGKMADEVQKDLADGTAAGISGTPGFIINGQLVSGAQPFSVFKQVIDQALNK